MAACQGVKGGTTHYASASAALVALTPLLKGRFLQCLAWPRLTEPCAAVLLPVRRWAKTPSNLALDDEINFAQADKEGSLWKAWAKLKLRLERISDRSYKANTKDFRNTYNHRFSPRVVVGQTNRVTRKVDAKSKPVSYGFGGTELLTLKVVELLEEQCQHCYKAFESFQKLVQEQEKAISAAAAETLAAMAASAKS